MVLKLNKYLTKQSFQSYEELHVFASGKKKNPILWLIFKSVLENKIKSSA